MKCLLVLAALVAYTQAANIAALPAATIVAAAPALLETGHSTQYRSQDNVGNYNFGYDEAHTSGATFRRESGSLGTKVGSYGLRDADGRVRVVNYVADAAGFRADIQTNEPGVEPKDPASTTINKAALVAAPVTQVVATAPAAIVAEPASSVIATPANSPISYSLPAAHIAAAPAAVSYAAVAAPVHYSVPSSKLTYSETTINPGKTIITTPAVHQYVAPAFHHYGVPSALAAHTIRYY